MALRRLEAAGFITRLRRKVVQSVVNRVRRIRFDCAVQTSNSYGFNLKPEENRRIEPDAKFRHETGIQIKTKAKAVPKNPAPDSEAELAAKKVYWNVLLLRTDKAG